MARPALLVERAFDGQGQVRGALDFIEGDRRPFLHKEAGIPLGAVKDVASVPGNGDS
jgi:hypothetical protein